METKKYHGILTALSPIHHGGSETYGTIKPILTLPTLVEAENGQVKVEDVPYIHGNAIRGYLRRLIMQDFLDQLKYELESPKIYHFLFSGGLLEASQKTYATVDTPLKKQLRENIPPVSLLGSAIGNQMIQGKLKVDLAEPICKELRRYQETYEGFQEISSYSLKARDYGTRLDDLREYKQTEEGEDEQKTQMKYEFEVIVQGAKFYHEFTLTDPTIIEEACFTRMLNLWKQRPYIGGKSGSGYGKIRIEYNYEPEKEKEYIDHLKENKEDITSFLSDLEIAWG